MLSLLNAKCHILTYHNHSFRSNGFKEQIRYFMPPRQIHHIWCQNFCTQVQLNCLSYKISTSNYVLWNRISLFELTHISSMLHVTYFACTNKNDIRVELKEPFSMFANCKKVTLFKIGLRLPAKLCLGQS